MLFIIQQIEDTNAFDKKLLAECGLLFSANIYGGPQIERMKFSGQR